MWCPFCLSLVTATCYGPLGIVHVLKGGFEQEGLVLFVHSAHSLSALLPRLPPCPGLDDPDRLFARTFPQPLRPTDLIP